MKNKLIKKITLTAMLSTLALLSFMLENLLPPVFFVGARLGLSNIFILISLIVLGPLYGFGAMLVKVILGSIFSSNPSIIIYSLPSNFLALTIEYLLIRLKGKFSIVSISIAGACVSTIIQNVIFCLITGSTEYFIYSPYLLLIAVGGGLIVGLTVYLIIKFIPTKYMI